MTKTIDSAASFAASVNVRNDSKFKPCVLCSGEKPIDHTSSNCVKYSSAQAKITQLKFLKACVKCGYTLIGIDKYKYVKNINVYVNKYTIIGK